MALPFLTEPPHYCLITAVLLSHCCHITVTYLTLLIHCCCMYCRVLFKPHSRQIPAQASEVCLKKCLAETGITRSQFFEHYLDKEEPKERQGICTSILSTALYRAHAASITHHILSYPLYLYLIIYIGLKVPCRSASTTGTSGTTIWRPICDE
jgi:predicted DNA-binding transcriptional regulator AlpA